MLLHLVAAAGVLALLTLAPGPDMAVVTSRALLGGRAREAVRHRPRHHVLIPKIAVVHAALRPTLASPDSGAWGLGALAIVHAGLTVAWLIGCAHLPDRARALLQLPRVRRTLDGLTGVVLVDFAIRLATAHP